MKINDKTVVITGAASGIGKALARKFMAEGAKALVGVDLNADLMQQTAAELGCIGEAVDVTNEAEVKALIDRTEQNLGPIDLFCSNAGVMTGFDEQSPDKEWALSWDVNVMAQVYAARHLVPRMVERGGGYFLHTASAAGLLNQIGGAAYGVSKHAAVGFAEWLAFTYAHQGIKVSLLCPQAVRTPMAEQGEDHEGLKAAAGDGMMEPEQLAEIVVEHLDREDFLILTHPEVSTYMQRKASDYGRWIGGMNRLLQRLKG